MIKLPSNKILPHYYDLDELYQPKQALIPPEEHAQHSEGREAYNQLSHELLDYLLDTRSIKQTNDPGAYQ